MDILTGVIVRLGFIVFATGLLLSFALAELRSPPASNKDAIELPRPISELIGHPKAAIGYNVRGLHFGVFVASLSIALIAYNTAGLSMRDVAILMIFLILAMSGSIEVVRCVRSHRR